MMKQFLDELELAKATNWDMFFGDFAILSIVFFCETVQIHM